MLLYASNLFQIVRRLILDDMTQSNSTIPLFKHFQKGKTVIRENIAINASRGTNGRADSRIASPTYRTGKIQPAAVRQTLTVWNTCKFQSALLWHRPDTWQQSGFRPSHIPQHSSPVSLSVLYPARLAYSDTEALITAQSNLSKHTNRLAA